MLSTLSRGVAAGAAGTTALNAATYVDMVVRARPSSDVPERAVAQLAERVGAEIPGDGDEQAARRQGLGSLTGIATGLGVGVVGGLLAPVLRRLPLLVSGGLLGGLAMAGSDLPAARIGVTQPSRWSAADWAADVVPHLAYGVAAAWVLKRRR